MVVGDVFAVAVVFVNSGGGGGGGSVIMLYGLCVFFLEGLCNGKRRNQEKISAGGSEQLSMLEFCLVFKKSRKDQCWWL